MRLLSALVVLIALAGPCRLVAQEIAPPQESSILVQDNLPELQQPREIEADGLEVPASPAGEGIRLPTSATWMLNLNFPRREHPGPLAWLRSDDTALEDGAEVRPGWLSRTGARFCGETMDTGYRLWRDFQFQYSLYPLAELGVAVAIATPLANTGADQRVRDWYQGRVHPNGPDWDQSNNTVLWRANRVGYYLGSFQYTVPIYFGVWGAGILTEDTWTGSVSAEWANRTLRALAIGAPEVGVLQYALGGSRPLDGDGSRWRPLHDNNGVSGHAFVGAVPFLTAASMIDNPWLRAPFIAGSFWSAWSRVDSDAHYLSQVLLGWFIAYQSVRSVNRTEAEDRQIQIGPWIDPGITGINVFLRY